MVRWSENSSSKAQETKIPSPFGVLDMVLVPRKLPFFLAGKNASCYIPFGPRFSVCVSILLHVALVAMAVAVFVHVFAQALSQSSTPSRRFAVSCRQSRAPLLLHPQGCLRKHGKRKANAYMLIRQTTKREIILGRAWPSLIPLGALLHLLL